MYIFNNVIVPFHEITCKMQNGAFKVQKAPLKYHKNGLLKPYDIFL